MPPTEMHDIAGDPNDGVRILIWAIPGPPKYVK